MTMTTTTKSEQDQELRGRGGWSVEKHHEYGSMTWLEWKEKEKNARGKACSK